LTAGLCNY